MLLQYSWDSYGGGLPGAHVGEVSDQSSVRVSRCSGWVFVVDVRGECKLEDGGPSQGLPLLIEMGVWQEEDVFGKISS